MRLTLGEKYSNVITGPRWMSVMFMLLAMLSALSCAMVDGWQFDMDPNVQLSEGDSCRLRSGESGICRRIETCSSIIEALDKKQIKYQALVRCTFAGLSEVICCPSGNTGTKPTRTNPLPSWDADITPPVRTTSTTTTSTTTTIRPLVIGDTVITGNEQFIDLSRVFGRTSSTTIRPWQNLEPSQGQNTGSNFGPNPATNFGPNPATNFQPNFVQNNNPNGGTNFGPNFGVNFRPGFRPNNNPHSGSNFRPGFERNNQQNSGANFVPNSVSNFPPGLGQNFNPNFEVNSQPNGPPINSWSQPNSGIGAQVRWPGQSNDRRQFTRGRPHQSRNPDATWLSPVNNNNIQGPTSANFVQAPTQLPQTNPQNPIAVFTDPFAPFQFRPGSNDPLPVETSTLRTVNSNHLDDNEWSWQSTNTERTTTTTTPSTGGATTTPVLDDWMLDALNGASSTTTEPTTSLSQTGSILDDWMVEALRNASTDVSTSTSTPVPVIPFSLNKCLELYTGVWSCPNATTPAPDIDIRVGTPPTVPTVTQPVSPRARNERPADTACRTYRELDPSSLTYHILDGLPVAPGDYPHMGGLIYPGSGSASQDLRCGSSLISARYVLTAAHCVNDPLLQPTTVRFGVVVWNVSNEDNTPVDVEIENIILHPNYLSSARYDDIALIRLVRDVEFTFAVRPACLYTNMADIDQAIKLVVIGWGVTNIQTRSRSEILLMTNVTTVAINECNATHVGLGLRRSLRNGLNLGQYCAYDAELKKDSCEADSGGPLQIVENKQSTIVGIVSFGTSCGSAVPSVYARVAYYLNWIESIVWPS